MFIGGFAILLGREVSEVRCGLTDELKVGKVRVLRPVHYLEALTNSILVGSLLLYSGLFLYRLLLVAYQVCCPCIVNPNCSIQAARDSLPGMLSLPLYVADNIWLWYDAAYYNQAFHSRKKMVRGPFCIRKFQDN